MYIQTCIQYVYISTFMNMSIPANMYMYTYMHTCIHPSIHPYIHTYIHACVCVNKKIVKYKYIYIYTCVYIYAAYGTHWMHDGLGSHQTYLFLTRPKNIWLWGTRSSNGMYNVKRKSILYQSFFGGTLTPIATPRFQSSIVGKHLKFHMGNTGTTWN